MILFNVFVVFGFENFLVIIIKILLVIKLIIIGFGLNKFFLIVLWNNMLSILVGIILIIICNKFNDGLFVILFILINDYRCF